MSLWHCKDCTAAYSVGAECCPQCGSKDYQTLPVARAYVCEGCETPYRMRLSSCPRCRGESFKEMSMAKITKAGGPSNNDLEPQEHVEEQPLTEVSVPEEPTPDTEPAGEPGAEEPVGEQVADEGEKPADGEDDEPRDYSQLTVAELREELDKRELSTSGVKADLVQRLTDHDQA